jgi:hypothetical protein
MNGNGKIKLFRKLDWFSCFSMLEVLVDGKKIGDIACCKEQTFEIAVGQHTIQVQCSIPRFVFWKPPIQSQLLDVDLSPNSSIELECGVPKQFHISILLMLATMLISNYFEDARGIYGVVFPITLFILTCFMALIWKTGMLYLKK